jgi:ribosomal protein S18 acetylase RimI-like enzyme
MRPLREDEFAGWRESHRHEYVEGLVSFAGLSREAAEAKAGADVAAVLPAGLATADTYLWVVEAEGRRVGTVFLGLRDGGAWLYDITIDEDVRGRGYGRAAMTALEKEARSRGFAGIGLNVWGGNAVARGLYRSLGYVEESVHMRKRL